MIVPTEDAVRVDGNQSDAVSVVLSRVKEFAPYAGCPASVRDVVDYTRAGGWIPGDHPWWVELPGYAYGYLIAIPVTVVLNAVAWVLQRFSRVAVVALVIGLLWWAGA